jgi:hypothetical protein
MEKKNKPIFLLFLEQANESPIDRYYNIRYDGQFGYQLVQIFYKPISFF